MQNFIFILIVSANVKIAMQCFEISGANTPNAPPPVARLTSVKGQP